MLEKHIYAGLYTGFHAQLQPSCIQSSNQIVIQDQNVLLHRLDWSINHGVGPDSNPPEDLAFASLRIRRTTMSRKVISVLLTLMILTALLSGCGKHSLADANSLTSAEGAADAQATSFVHGASSLSYICVAEEGVFYIDGTGSGHFLCYYDYDADAHFVLCNAPECSHMNEECPGTLFSLKYLRLFLGFT